MCFKYHIIYLIILIGEIQYINQLIYSIFNQIQYSKVKWFVNLNIYIYIYIYIYVYTDNAYFLDAVSMFILVST